MKGNNNNNSGDNDSGNSGVGPPLDFKGKYIRTKQMPTRAKKVGKGGKKRIKKEGKKEKKRKGEEPVVGLS